MQLHNTTRTIRHVSTVKRGACSYYRVRFRVPGRGKPVEKFFSITTLGEEKALEAAILWRDSQYKIHNII